MYPEIVKEIEMSLYVDDLISGGADQEKARELKETATEIFDSATFVLHKWHSNVPELEATPSAPELETPPSVESNETETIAKQKLGIPKGEEASVLVLTWHKRNETIGVKFPSNPAERTKRGILGKVARVYDPHRLVSPVSLTGKLLYREACDAKLAWDAELPYELSRKLMQWEEGLLNEATTNRSLAVHHELINDIHLHAFDDVSRKGVAAAVVFQDSGLSQGLVTAKARLVKQGLTIPRLELISGHMAVNLITNVKNTLEGLHVSQLYCWLDSTVALHWIRGN